MVDEMVLMATHGILLVTAIAGLVTSLLNRKKLKEIHISVNGGLTEKIAMAIKASRDTS